MNRFQTLILYIVSLIFVFTPTLLFILLCTIYRSCVSAILKIKYGNKFGGMLTGEERIFNITNEATKKLTNILVIVEFEGDDFYEPFKRLIYERAFANPDRLIKCAGVQKCEYGFTFILKNEYTVNECVKILRDDVEDEEDLQKVLSKYAHESLPKNHSTFWEVLVCKKKIRWRDHEKHCVPVIIRCNHALGETRFITKVLSDCQKSVESSVLSNSFLKTCYNLATAVKVIYYLTWLPFILFHHISRPSDMNPIHGLGLSKKKILVWKIFESPIQQQIERIKTNDATVRFTSVWYTAIAATFEKYFEKNEREVPEEFTIGSAVCRTDLSDGFSAIVFPVPLRWEPNFLTDRLKEINKRYNDQLNSKFVQVAFYFIHFGVPLLPKIFLIGTTKVFDCSLGFSNCLTFPSASFNGHRVVDIIGWANNFDRVGVNIGLTTYGEDRVQLSLAVDSLIMDSKEEAIDILETIGKCMNEMDLECFTTIKIP